MEYPGRFFHGWKINAIKLEVATFLDINLSVRIRQPSFISYLSNEMRQDSKDNLGIA